MTEGESENGKWKIENRRLKGELGRAAERKKITLRRRVRGGRRRKMKRGLRSAVSFRAAENLQG